MTPSDDDRDARAPHGGPADAAPFDTGLRADELDPERPRALETPWGSYSLFRLPSGVRCVQSFCPHLAGPLFQGTVSQVGAKGWHVTCPWHRWRFSLDSGRRLDGAHPAHEEHLLVCPVHVSEGGTLLLAPPHRLG